MKFKRLKDLRVDHDKTQKEIGEVLNCLDKVYGTYERGERELPISMAINLAKYYNVTLDYLTGLSDRKETDFWIK